MIKFWWKLSFWFTDDTFLSVFTWWRESMFCSLPLSIRALIPFVSTPPLWTYYLSKVPPPETFKLLGLWSFELVFVSYGVKLGSNSFLLHSEIQLSQHHFLKGIFFPSLIVFAQNQLTFHIIYFIFLPQTILLMKILIGKQTDEQTHWTKASNAE